MVDQDSLVSLDGGKDWLVSPDGFLDSSKGDRGIGLAISGSLDYARCPWPTRLGRVRFARC
jgi:hypothetical protein